MSKIQFKSNKRMGFLCELCGATWYEGESINENTGHFIESLKKDGNWEYTFVDTGEDDEESKSVMYPKFT